MWVDGEEVRDLFFYSIFSFFFIFFIFGILSRSDLRVWLMKMHMLMSLHCFPGILVGSPAPVG